MLIKVSQIRQQQLDDILRDMAKSAKDDTELRRLIFDLKSAYSDDFRHRYSEFFPLIVEMSRDDNDYDLDFLSTNLNAVHSLVEEYYLNEPDNYKELYSNLSKLSDHINLEIGRYNQFSINDKRLGDINTQYEQMQKSIITATEELTSAQKTVSSVQTELIAVLSIFAAIVLTFSGSISFLSSALSSIGDTPFFKAVFFILLCGFILINAIFMLLYIVGKITNRSIYARCESENCTCLNKKGKPKCLGITRLRKRLPYVFWINIVLILFMIGDITLWVCFPWWGV